MMGHLVVVIRRAVCVPVSESPQDLRVPALRGFPAGSRHRGAQGPKPSGCRGGGGHEDSDGRGAAGTRSNKETKRLMWVFFQDEELQRTCTESANIQAAYGHYFDLSIINDNLDETYRTVRAALGTVSKNPQWVPVTWVF